MERLKNCRYCQKEFVAKRIDARYCSVSCRQMGNRRDNDPATYGKVVPIYFELDDHEYADVLQKAEELEMHPNEYVKELILNKDDFLSIHFTSDERNDFINFLKLIYDDSSEEKIVKDLFLIAAKAAIENYK